MERQARLGMALFAVADSIFFIVLILAFWSFRTPTAQNAPIDLNVVMTSFVLAASGLTIWHAGRNTGKTLWVLSTIFFAVAFLFGQAALMIRMAHSGITVSRSLFGTAYFVLIGAHSLHALVGFGLLLATTSKTASRYIESVTAFWYLVIGLWFAIFAVVYVRPFV